MQKYKQSNFKFRNWKTAKIQKSSNRPIAAENVAISIKESRALAKFRKSKTYNMIQGVYEDALINDYNTYWGELFTLKDKNDNYHSIRSRCPRNFKLFYKKLRNVAKKEGLVILMTRIHCVNCNKLGFEAMRHSDFPDDCDYCSQFNAIYQECESIRSHSDKVRWMGIIKKYQCMISWEHR